VSILVVAAAQPGLGRLSALLSEPKLPHLLVKLVVVPRPLLAGFVNFIMP